VTAPKKEVIKTMSKEGESKKLIIYKHKGNRLSRLSSILLGFIGHENRKVHILHKMLIAN